MRQGRCKGDLAFTVTAGTFHAYYVYDVGDCQTVADGETSVTLTIPEKSKGNYFVRVQHPDGVTWWDFYASLPADGVTVTKGDLYIGSSELTSGRRGRGIQLHAGAWQHRHGGPLRRGR